MTEKTFPGIGTSLKPKLFAQRHNENNNAFPYQLQKYAAGQLFKPCNTIVKALSRRIK